jgi:hypothetical protein
MAYQFRTTEAYAEIDAAQRAVKAATERYSRGGSPDGLNKANRRLADARGAADRVSTGLSCDDK